MPTLPKPQSVIQVILPPRGRLAAKRLFDIVRSALGLLVLSPLLLVIALLVGMTSPGGIIFRQERMGRGELPLQICKFRTMRKDNA